MLEAFDILAERLETLPLAVRQEMVGLVNHFGGTLLELNRNYLAKEGRRPDGEPIQDTAYSDVYAAYKRKYAKFTNTDFVDLKFSGDFLASFVLEYQGNGVFLIVATDKKADFLEKYGQLLGIREEDLEDFVRTILEPAIRQFITTYMQF